MTESGATPLEDGQGEGSGKPTWRRSGSGSQPAPVPAVEPVPEEEAEPADFGDGTLIEQPPETGAIGSDSGIDGEHTMVSHPEGDTTMMSGALPEIPGITLTRELGRGGMGIVYEGKQGYLDRRVAVKFLGEGNLTTEFMRRFQREAKILASLGHSNVVGCYQAGVAKDGRCFLVMEFIDGPTLGDWIGEHGEMSDDCAVSVCRAVASALAYAHGAGIIHRDVKPPNVLLKTKQSCDPDDPFPYEPMLADLGLARASGEVPTLVDITMQGLTAHGAVMGSPPTMAPEQFDAPDDVDFRTDIYGLGCVLFHCLTGKLAFPQGTLTKLISRKAAGKPPDPREMKSNISPQLAALVGDMLAPLPEDRPASYDELLRRFEGPFEPGKPARPKTLVYGAAAAVLFVGAWATWSALSSDDPIDDRANGDPDVARIDEDPPDETPLENPDGLGGGSGDEGGDAGPGEFQHRTDNPQNEGDLPTPLGGGQEGTETGELAAYTGEDGAGTGTEGTGEVDEVPDVTPPGEDGNDQTGTDPNGTGGDAEPVETFVLPVGLPTIAAGEAWELFESTMNPLVEWEVTAGEPAKWEATGDEKNSTSAVFYVGQRGVAVRSLPAPAWSLTGDMSLLRQLSDETPRRAQVVIVMEGGRGLVLEQALVENELRLSGAWAAPREGGGWVTEEELPELFLGTLAWSKKGPAVGFQVAWDGELLTVAWSLSAGEEDAARVELTREHLAATGAPVKLGIELENGPGKLHGFVVEGR